MTFDPNFPQTGSVPPGGFIIQEELKSAFDATTGHSHNGTDSKVLAGGTADDTTLTLTEGVFAVKAKGIAAAQMADTTITAAQMANTTITKAKLAAATQSTHIVDAEAAAGEAPTKAEYDALVGKFNALLVACEKVFLATS